MQRWIALAVVGMVLLIGGGAFGFRAYKNSRPYPVWVPLPLNDSLPEEDRKTIAKQLEEALRKPAVVSSIVKDLGLVPKFKVASEEAAVAELNRRLFVRLASGTSSMGTRTQVLEIGVDGIRGEKDLLAQIVKRLTDEVGRLLNLAEKPQRPAF